jgi:hypothetical protein
LSICLPHLERGVAARLDLGKSKSEIAGKGGCVILDSSSLKYRLAKSTFK